MEPSEKGTPPNEEGSEGNKKPVAPSLFDVPSKPNYHPSTGLVHCRITRRGKSQYHLSFQAADTETVSIIANKVVTSRTPNYHLFDALRGGTNAKLSKKGERARD